jgi:hypothetical protein
MRNAKNGLRLTHIRDDPPDVFKHPEFYDAVRAWPAAHAACPARRIIAVTNPRMRQWAQELREDEAQHPNFSVRVTSRSAGLPVINMAILDEENVFLFISGEKAEDTAGVWIRDREVTGYFIRYYDNLWFKSQPLAEALAAPIDEMGT